MQLDPGLEGSAQDDFAWNSDGSMLAFVNEYRLMLYDMQKRKFIPNEIQPENCWYEHISFRPNRRELYTYKSNIPYMTPSSGYRVDLVRINIETLQIQDLWPREKNFDILLWSPDGSEMIVRNMENQSNGVGDHHLYRYNADGTGEKYLTTLHTAFNVAWMPIGNE